MWHVLCTNCIEHESLIARTCILCIEHANWFSGVILLVRVWRAGYSTQTKFLLVSDMLVFCFQLTVCSKKPKQIPVAQLDTRTSYVLCLHRCWTISTYSFDEWLLVVFIPCDVISVLYSMCVYIRSLCLPLFGAHVIALYYLYMLVNYVYL